MLLININKIIGLWYIIIKIKKIIKISCFCLFLSFEKFADLQIQTMYY